MRWFTSDTHFSHSGILRHEAEVRKFRDTSEMDETLIRNWNAVVAPDDLVFHLGDVAMGPIAESLPLIGRLNGSIFLVPGNHDRVFSGAKASQQERFQAEYRKVFVDILPEQQMLDLADGTTVTLCHFPYEGDSHGSDRYSELRPVDDGKPLIHGHVHSMWRTRGRQFNVGVDVNGLTPVSEDTIIDWVQTL